VSSARQGRSRQSTYTLIGALGASLAIVLVIVLVTVRPANTERAEVDWHAVHDGMPSAAQFVDPEFTAADGDWWSNRAELTGGTSPEWYIGLVTPTAGFVVIEQFTGDPSPEIASELDDVTPTTATVAGYSWAVFDRTTVKDPGNRVVIYLLSGVGENGSLMVSGSATVDEIELAATRAVESLGGTP
jgi:hypothetical protein